MKRTINRIGNLFRMIVANADKGEYWKNIPLSKEAFALMKQLPETLAGEFETPADKAALLGQMLDHTYETMTPRFSLEVRAYMLTLDPHNENNLKAVKKLQDFISPSIPVEEYCKKYRVHLLFDPVERTEKWEDVIYDVEKALADKFRFTRRHMGFCFRFWMAKEEELASRGIRWRNPHLMNPRVMFD